MKILKFFKKIFLKKHKKRKKINSMPIIIDTFSNTRYNYLKPRNRKERRHGRRLEL